MHGSQVSEDGAAGTYGAERLGRDERPAACPVVGEEPPLLLAAGRMGRGPGGERDDVGDPEQRPGPPDGLGDQRLGPPGAAQALDPLDVEVVGEDQLHDVAEADQKWPGVSDPCFEAGVQKALLGPEGGELVAGELDPEPRN